MGDLHMLVGLVVLGEPRYSGCFRDLDPMTGERLAGSGFDLEHGKSMAGCFRYPCLRYEDGMDFRRSQG